jgi:uncharacterized protein (DUF885 family)
MRLWIYAALAAAIAGCAPAAPPAATAAEVERAGAELTTYLDAEYEEALAMSPIGLTMLGRKEQYDKLDDFSEGQIDRELIWRRESVAEMKKRFDPAMLDEEARTSFEMWTLQLELNETAAQFRTQPYLFVKDGPHVFLPNFLINFHAVNEKADMTAYVARLRELGRALDQGLERAKASAAAGDRPPRFSYQQSREEALRVISGAPFEAGGASPLWVDVKAKINNLLEGDKLTPGEAQAIEGEASKALLETVKPAYVRLIAWLAEDVAKTLPDAKGAASLTSGADYYNAQLYIQTTTRMSADEIHALGLSEVARIRSEMETIREQVAFKGDLPAFFEFMRKDKQFYLADTDEGRAAYLKQADAYLAGMKAKLPEYFGILPKADLVVRRVEAFREEPGGVQHYYPGTPDGSRPGIYYAHLSDMSAMPLWDLENTTYHEGLPGHHMQISIAQELSGLPVFRTQSSYTAYSEGWGLYTELLGKEMGFYHDPYSDLGRLNAEMWRAVRLVVDTGIHAKGWSEEQAVKYFMQNSPTPEAAVRAEIRRYFVWPGQATSYKIGMLKILELRALAQTELGAKFTYAGFHDAVLSGGALPLPVLEARVKRWIEKLRAA